MPYKRAKTASTRSEVIRSQTLMRAVGDFLFLGNRVYLFIQPDRILTVKKIHWDREASDLEDERGQVYRDVSWDEMEFADDVEYHFPDDEWGTLGWKKSKFTGSDRCSDTAFGRIGASKVSPWVDTPLPLSNGFTGIQVSVIAHADPATWTDEDYLGELI